MACNVNIVHHRQYERHYPLPPRGGALFWGELHFITVDVPDHKGQSNSRHWRSTPSVRPFFKMAILMAGNLKKSFFLKSFVRKLNQKYPTAAVMVAPPLSGNDRTVSPCRP
jgi:hypothetical protein